MPQLIHRHGVDEVILGYTDLEHESVMHKRSSRRPQAPTSRCWPDATMLHSTKPVVAATAVRTGCGTSQTSRRVGQALLRAGLRWRSFDIRELLRLVHEGPLSRPGPSPRGRTRGAGGGRDRLRALRRRKSQPSAAAVAGVEFTDARTVRVTRSSCLAAAGESRSQTKSQCRDTQSPRRSSATNA